MKTLKFLFVAALFTCFVGIIQANAQAYINDKGYELKELIYEVDGNMYAAFAELQWHMVLTTSGQVSWVSNGSLSDSEVWMWDPENPDAQWGGWVLIDYLPLPSRTIVGYDPNFGDEAKITPSGRVHVNIKAEWW